ncbi:MAG: hypothetical protein ABIH17_01765 [Pseudomonadota bacterium]
MRKRNVDLEGLVEVLNQMGIRMSIAGGSALTENLVARAIRVTQEADKYAAEEIARIAANAKRSTSR